MIEETLTGNETTRKLEDQKRKILFKKHQSWFRSTYEKAEFKEPIVILCRRGRKTEFFEDVKAGEWVITHSDGKERTIILDPMFIRSFDYGKTTFQGYICNEDSPLPIPEDPFLTAELTGIALEKTLNDIKKWKTQEIKAKTEFVWKLLIGLAILFGMYILYRMLTDTDPITAITTAKNITQNITQPAIQEGVMIIQ